MAEGKIERIMNFLEQGDEDLKVGKKRDVVLVLGEAHADKSSLTRFIVGDDQNLVSRGLRFGKDWVFRLEQGFTRSVVSSAFIPALVVDNNANGAVFYDCPDFSDEKEEAEDIASAYFTQKVISRAESAKLVLVLKYDSIKQGGSEAVEKFLSKTSAFIKNLEKFKESIGIVITQVDASLPDVSIRNSLSSIHQKLLSKGKTAEANLLSILLTPGKMGVWKKPNGPGRVRNMRSVQDGRKPLRKLIYEELRFAVYDPKDFGIVLSKNSELYLPKLAEKMNGNMVAGVAKIGDQFTESFRELENTSRDVDALFGRFYGANNIYRYKLNSGNWNVAKDAKGFVRQCLAIAKELDINLSKENLLSLLNSDLYLTFVDTALGQPAKRQVNWADGFEKFVRYLDQSYLWYQNLANLQNVDLSSYKTQQNIESIKGAAEELKATVSKGGNFSKRFEQFLRAINQHEGIIDLVVGLDVDERKKKLLLEVVDITIENNLTKTCVDNKLTISGQFVRISDLKNCEAVKCCENPREVELFATHKVFFDADIDWTSREVQLSIIAPTWEVIGERKIILDGKPGESPKVSKESALNDRAGSPGNPGEPGLPGGSAGGLVAIGQKCVACDQLTISLVGGKGGAGQDGGDGLKGEDGTRPYNPKNDRSYSSMKDLWRQRGHQYRCNPELIGRTITENCLAYGLDGKVGGKGGDGGKGGIGGASGRVSMVFIQDHGSPIVKAENGPQGANGKGGKGGEGGEKGDNLTIDVYYYHYVAAQTQYIPSLTKAASGAQGVDGLNIANAKLPQYLNFINPSFPLSNYKAFLRSNLNRSLQNSHNFLEYLGSDERVINLYDTMGLVKDMQCLEKQFYDLQNRIPFLPHYTNLQKRIDAYGDKLVNTKENDDDHKMVLSYLYSSVLTKIRNINNKLNEGLVVNIAGHLNSVKTDISKLKQTHEAVNKNKSKQVYQESIKGKVEEANSFIAGVIEPEIKNTIRKTDEQINSLIDETMALEAAAKKERDQLIIKQHTLEDQLVLRYLLGTVEVASQLLALAGPVGATVGTVIGGVNQVAQGLLLTDDDGNHDLKAVPEGVKKSFSAISDHFQKKKESFNQQLTDAKESLDKLDKETLSDISIKAVKEKIQETQNKLKIEMEKQSQFDPESVDRMYNMRKELEDSLDKEKELLEKAGGKADKKVDYIGKVTQLIEVGKAGKEVYDKIKKSKGAIDKLGDSIKKANDNIAKLELQEQNIYKTIMPMVKGISDTMNNLHNEASSKSHAALDVSKWQIQSNIRDISKKLKEMTEGYKAQGELTYLMDKVEHGMSTMIQVYDRIQDYQEKAELADYLAQISLARNNVGNIKDAGLKDAVDYLEMNMHFNIVLSEYEKSIEALKHSVFPFAKRYLKSPQNVTSKYQFDESLSHIENVVNGMIKDFDDFIQELGKSEDILFHTDQFVNPDQPYMSALNSNPFYSWKFTGHEDIIEKLLDGREVVLAADVANEQVENLMQNAVKFNVIGIDLQLSDPASQSKMKTVLEGFKVNMTHLGHSHYVCGSKSYTLVHNPETIQHSVNKLVDKGRAEYYAGSGNKVYNKLRDNEALLSPYTTWKINLFRDTSKRGDHSFSKLTEFKGQPIELELEGNGQYIRRDYQANEQICNNELDKFYQEVKTSAKADNIDLQQELDIWEILADDHENEVKRSRRSADESATDASNTSFFSGALVSISQATTKYLNPVQWFTSYNVTQDRADYLNGVLPNNVEIRQPSENFILHSGEYSVKNEVDPGLLNLQGNLLLMGLLGHKRSKPKIRKNIEARDASGEFAHSIAYRAYAPKK